MNGGINKLKQEFALDLSNRTSLRLADILKEACRQFNQKEKVRTAKLYM